MQITRLIVASLLASAMTLTAVADDNKKEKAVSLKAESVKRAKFIDFMGELGVSLTALDDLGVRIDKARLASDPIQLMQAASLLAAAESIADKKASLTAESLTEEAVVLAELRGDPVEMVTLGKLVGGDVGGKLAKAAKAVSEKEVKAGEGTRELEGTLIVDNRHNHDEVHVYVDGREIGHVRGHGVRYFYGVHAHRVTARDHFGHRWYRNIDRFGHIHRYVFHLEPPHHHH